MSGLSPGVTVGIDVGTTSVKAVAATREGAVVARARIPHRLSAPSPDRLEHDVAVAWRRGPRRALDALHLSEPPRAVSVSAMTPSIAAVTRTGAPLTPGILYGDARGRDPANAESTGSESIRLLSWCASSAPDAYGYWPAAAVANHALGGAGVLDSVTALSTYPLYNGIAWDPGLLAQCGVSPASLPSVRPSGSAFGTLRGSDTVLVAGCVDALCEQIVADADEVGDVLVICGGTLVVWVVVASPVEVPGLWTVPHTAQGKFLVGGPSNAGGIFVDWALRLFAKRGGDRSLDPPSIPVFSPYPRGERVPLHDPYRTAKVAGLHLGHGPAECRRAVFEAAGFAARHIIDLAGISTRRIVAAGGGVNRPEWIEALADCTGLPVDVVAVPEGGALGGAWLARMGVEEGLRMEEARAWARTAGRVDPDPRWVAAANDRYREYRLMAEVARS